jgi:capsular polysaccharide biosynthesis protein
MRTALSVMWRKVRRRLAVETYHLVPFESVENSETITARTIFNRKTTYGAAPVFIGNSDLCDVSGYDGSQPSPEVRLLQMNDVCAVGRTEFVLKDQVAFYPGALDPKTYAFMHELEGRGSVDLDQGNLRIAPKRKSQKVAAAISLLGQCNGNYAHWITEVLTRLVLVDDIPELRDLPILVDQNVHEKLFYALELMNSGRRKVIPVRPYEKVHARRLVYVTLPSVTPAETRRFFESGKLDILRATQFQFSAEALQRLRLAATEVARNFGYPPPNGFNATPKFSERANESRYSHQKPKLVYLGRFGGTTGNSRFLLNADGVLNMVLASRFTVINTFDLPFELQVLAMQDAEIVIAPIGAALANMAFCPPGRKVIILTPTYAGANFHYFSNFLVSLGHEVIFVLGPQVAFASGPVYNRNYLIDLSDLNRALHHFGLKSPVFHDLGETKE